MNKPACNEPYPDRLIDCQFALEDHFNELVEAAEAAGWSPSETAVALGELSDNLILKLHANDETRAQIRRLRH
jgi:hypothetical protein